MDNNVTTVDGSNSILAGRGQVELKDNGDLKVPDNIIVTPTSARAYYNNFRASHVNRIKLYAAIEGLLAGNPPYDSQMLAAAGLSHITNVNNLDAKSKYEKTALSFWNLINQTQSMVKFKLRKFKMQQDQDFANWSAIMSKHWTEVIKEMWEDFIPELNKLTGQLVKFGVSPLVFSDEEDLRWNTVDLSKFFVADQTEVTQKNWDCICLESKYTMQFLYSVLENLKDKEDSDWNKEALQAFILKYANNAVKGSNNRTYGSYLEFQQRLQNGDINQGNIFTDSVPLVSLLYKEYSGKISHYIFDPLVSGNDGFLYENKEQFEAFSEVVNVFTYSPGEFTIHGNRGVGHKIFPACQALMQLDCHMIDMAKMSATPIVRSAAGVKDVNPIRFIPGVATDIGTAEFIQNNLGANLEGLTIVAGYLENKVSRNAIIGGDDPSQPDQDRGSKSAPEAMMQSVKEFGVGKNHIQQFYNGLDKTFYNMTAKMYHAKPGSPCYDIAEEWKTRCIDDGVPEMIFETKDSKRNRLPAHVSLRASRVAGDGSNLGFVMGLSGIGSIAGGFSAKGQYNYRTDIITSRLGDDYVERYIGDSLVPDEATGGASLAALENIALKSGENPQATKDNQHKAHIGSHLALITQTIQGVQAQKIDPIEADKLFELTIGHTELHINFVKEDPLNVAFIEKIQGPWRQIVKFAQLNRIRAQKIQQTEIRRRSEEQQQLSADMMEQDRKDKIAQRDQARNDYKVQSQVERAKEANVTRGEVMKEAVNRKAENERLAVTLKHDNEREAIIRKPQEQLANQSTSQLQSNLESQVGTSPNPADFL